METPKLCVMCGDSLTEPEELEHNICLGCQVDIDRAIEENE